MTEKLSALFAEGHVVKHPKHAEYGSGHVYDVGDDYIRVCFEELGKHSRKKFGFDDAVKLVVTATSKVCHAKQSNGITKNPSQAHKGRIGVCFMRNCY